MIVEAGTVKRHRLDAAALARHGNQFAHGFGSLDVAAVRNLATHFGFHGGRSSEHPGTATGDNLGVNVAIGTKDGQTDSLKFRNLGTGFTCLAQTRDFLCS